MTRFWDRRTDGRTDGRSDCTPRPAFAFGDAGKNKEEKKTATKQNNVQISMIRKKNGYKYHQKF